MSRYVILAHEYFDQQHARDEAGHVRPYRNSAYVIGGQETAHQLE